jgi:hypothetical protein
MKNRRSFLAAVASGGVGLALMSKGAGAQTETPAPAAPSAKSPHPARQPATGKPPSAVAVAMAATFRSFDPHLTDSQLATIAKSIDDNRAAGARLNPKRARLRNGNEPVTHFTVPSENA